MLKEYIALKDFSLSTSVVVDGREVRICFGGGCMKPLQNGTFTTADGDLQAAIEGSRMFGRTIGLKRSWGQEEEVPELATGLPMAVLEVKVCRTVNEAADWLVGLGCRKGEVNTSAKAVEQARLRGFELRFEREG